MANRLLSFGFGVKGADPTKPDTVTAANIKQFMRDQVSQTFQFQSQPVNRTGIAGLNPFGQRSDGGSPFVGFGQGAVPQGTGAKTVYNPGAGPATFQQQIFPALFGAGKNDTTIKGLFGTEAEGLAAIDALFAKDPQIGDRLFKSTQDIANQLQATRDDRQSGGPAGGPLKVLTAGLGFTGAGNALLSGVSSKIGPVATQALKGAATNALVTGATGGKFGDIAKSAAVGGITGAAGAAAQKAASPLFAPGGKFGSPVIGNTAAANALGLDPSQLFNPRSLGGAVPNVTTNFPGGGFLNPSGFAGFINPNGTGTNPATGQPSNPSLAGLRPFKSIDTPGTTMTGSTPGGGFVNPNALNAGPEDLFQPRGLATPQQPATGGGSGNALSNAAKLIPGIAGGAAATGAGGQPSSPVSNALAPPPFSPLINDTGGGGGNPWQTSPVFDAVRGGGASVAGSTLRSGAGSGQQQAQQGRVPGYQRRPFANYLMMGPA